MATVGPSNKDERLHTADSKSAAKLSVSGVQTAPQGTAESETSEVSLKPEANEKTATARTAATPEPAPAGSVAEVSTVAAAKIPASGATVSPAKSATVGKLAQAPASVSPEGPLKAPPVTMLNPSGGDGLLPGPLGEKHFAGEMEGDFEPILAMAGITPTHRMGRLPRIVTRLVAPLAGLLSARLEEKLRVASSEQTALSDRKVAFDGFKTDLHDEKTERDRRYGTVYKVLEYPNAYLVRLEMPRHIPTSALKQVWNLPDEMPDYDYDIGLADRVLVIYASVRGEALRRLSYISSAFPSGFMTRIEFDRPVSKFRHRLRNKVLEIIAFKDGQIRLGHTA
jgi:hypothetical protein